MFSPYLRRIIIDVCLCLAFAFGVYFFYKSFIDFLISLFHFSKVNISSLAYCVQRILIVLLPLIMLTARLPGGKNATIKYMLYTIGICYLMANAWILYYMTKHSIADVFIASVPDWFVKGDFQTVVETARYNCESFQRNNALVFNYLIWDSYDFFGIIFSTIMGILYINLAKSIGWHKDIVLKKFLIICILTILLPQTYGMLVRGRLMFTNDWGQRNMLLLFEMLFIFISLKIASTARVFWSDILF